MWSALLYQAGVLEENNSHDRQRLDKPPVVFNIVVPGVGLEPTKALARGS